MPNSPLLQIPQVATNQTLKETTINDGFSIVERSLNDVKSVDLTSADVELNITDYTRAFLMKTTGNAVPRNLTVPASKRLFSVYNGGSATVTVIAKDSVGMTADIPASSFVVLYNDEVDIRIISDSAASGQVSAFLSLPDTPNSFAGAAGQALVVNGTEDGLIFGTITVSFLQLTDSPASYSGQAGKTIKVNAGATGIEFTDYITTLLQLTDFPADFTAQAGKMLVVNNTEDALEFIDVPEPVIITTRDFTLTNAGFETGDTTSWTEQVGDVWEVNTSWTTVTAVEGIYFVFQDFENGNEPIKISYDITLTDQATTTEIDAGLEIQVTVGMASSNADFGFISIDFFDVSDILISTATGPQYTGTDTFIDRVFQVVVPNGARTATINLNAESNPAATIDNLSTAFAFDDLRVALKLEVPLINQWIQLEDTPNSFAGYAGRTVVVNATEDALEFGNPIIFRDNFTELLDTPANYTGHAGKVVKVTVGEDGLEFGALTFTALTDAPSSFAGHSGKFVRVNIGETALEFTDELNFTQAVEVSFFTESTLVANEVVFAYIPTANMTIPSGLTSSTIQALVAATAETVLSVKKNGVEVGTATFAAAGTVATLAMAVPTALTAGTDILTVVAPASPDATLADLIGSIYGTVG